MVIKSIPREIRTIPEELFFPLKEKERARVSMTEYGPEDFIKMPDGSAMLPGRILYAFVESSRQYDLTNAQGLRN
jgi:hypothetical protein